MANRWGNKGNSERFFGGASKSLQIVTAAKGKKKPTETYLRNRMKKPFTKY